MKCSLPVPAVFSRVVKDIYESYCDKDVSLLSIPDSFIPWVECVNGVVGVSASYQPSFVEPPRMTLPDSKDVVLLFSGGLDSVYYALKFRDDGYNVHLLHFAGLNRYEGNRPLEVVEKFAKDFGFDLVVVPITPGKCAFNENPIKNQFLLACAIDFCIARGWNHISLGQDVDLDLIDKINQVKATGLDMKARFKEELDRTVGSVEFSVTDCVCNDEAFFDVVNGYVGNLVYLQEPAFKTERLKYLHDRGALDSFYSCVMTSAYFTAQRNSVLRRFSDIELGTGCGVCRKCCLYNLIMHYTGLRTFPQDYVDYCWSRLEGGRFAEVSLVEHFGPDVPLETKISNLLAY